MSVITIPAGLVVEKQTWSQRRNDVLFRSVFGSQSVEVSPPQWETTITAPTMYESAAADWQVLLMQMKGQVNQLACYNFARPVPLGTMRGTMILGADVSAGATSLVLPVPQDQTGTSLKKGDFLGIGSGVTQQLIMVTSNVESVYDPMTLSLDFTTQTYQVQPPQSIIVNFEPPLRNPFTAGTGITWNKPTALFRRNDSKSSWDYSTNFVDGFSLSLIEDWRP